MTTVYVTTQRLTATALDDTEGVNNMALRKRKAPRIKPARSWDSLSESDKDVWLESERRDSKPRLDQPDWRDASVMRRFQ